MCRGSLRWVNGYDVLQLAVVLVEVWCALDHPKPAPDVGEGYSERLLLVADWNDIGGRACQSRMCERWC